MARELNRIEVLRNDFVRNVSHEFKTPIVSICGFARLLKKETISSERRDEYLDIIIQESERLSRLAENVLLLSKLEHQEIVADVVPFSLDEQIRQAILVLQPIWSKKELDLQIDLESAVFTGSKEIIQQLWLNLLSNAIKFTPSSGGIKVSLRGNEGRILVSVSDTGVGMDQETQKHLFEKFYQGDRSHSTEGNGLGMSLVSRIAELCEGRISVQSKYGEGTTVTVELPDSAAMPKEQEG